ncbi:hypothetical protein NECAME_12166 [Necator americanus]|uniref:Uncharacterized protein n=1 Tax=Necator americanus TaxID=51031 RepID=W2T2J9_NECAM|nr:hypothetical protein NECAME_12166 [Necator americanus]ETN75759.1 hypothetical protein NECAME_12166 [Necator americanus]
MRYISQQERVPVDHRTRKTRTFDPREPQRTLRDELRYPFSAKFQRDDPLLSSNSWSAAFVSGLNAY